MGPKQERRDWEDFIKEIEKDVLKMAWKTHSRIMEERKFREERVWLEASR